MPLLTLRDGARLQVELAGDGRHLVFVSGLGGTAAFWRPLIGALGPGLAAIHFDQRGIAASERGSLPVTVTSLAEDTWEIVDQLGVDRPIICGHSTGGAIAQEMALMRPGAVAGLVLSGSWAGPDWFLERMFSLRLHLLTTDPARYSTLSALLGSPPRWLRDHPDALSNAADRMLGDAEVAIVRERIEALLAHDCRGRISAITAPVLILGAEDDMIVPPYLQEEIAALLPAAELCIFQSGGHFFPVTRPTDTAAVLSRWSTAAIV